MGGAELRESGEYFSEEIPFDRERYDYYESLSIHSHPNQEILIPSIDKGYRSRQGDLFGLNDLKYFELKRGIEHSPLMVIFWPKL